MSGHSNPQIDPSQALKQLSIFNAHISIPLTKGYVTVVSPEDSDLAGFNWHVLPCKHTIYAIRTIRLKEDGSRSTQCLHRVILQRILDRPLQRGEFVDHRDGNGLNNRRENIRLASNTENTRNQRKSSVNTSGHKGVHWHKGANKWVAKISVNGKLIYLGCFVDIEDAAAAYRQAADKHHGDFANYGDEK